MRAIEAALFVGAVSPDDLMERAGKAVADSIQSHLGSARARRAVFLIGPGNNGGDGLIAARHLYDAGADTAVYLLTQRGNDDPPLRTLLAAGAEVYRVPEEGTERLDEDLRRADVVIDAILGIGQLRPLQGVLATASGLIRSSGAQVLSVDIASGVDADSGTADPHAVQADVTLALGFAKLGSVVWPGSSLAGSVRVVDIGIPSEAATGVSTSVLTPEWARRHLPERPGDSNKGTYGRVMLLAGSENYTGAPLLAARSALRSGAGLVTLAGTREALRVVRAQMPEVTYLLLPETPEGEVAATAGDEIIRSIAKYDAILIGPGMGQSSGVRSLVRGLLSHPRLESLPVILDADALNALARERYWQAFLPQSCVLTPHPGEFARLVRRSVAEVQTDRLAEVRAAAKSWDCCIVLKGAHTVIANAEGEALISPVVNPALATAGTGDVLAGVIAGLAAQGLSPWHAACLGTYLHGAAAERFRAIYGPSGLLASELGGAVAEAAASLRRSDGPDVQPQS